MSIALAVSMVLGMLFGHGVVMLIIIEKGRREDIRRYGHDLYPIPGARLAYWIGTPLTLAGIVAASLASL